MASPNASHPAEFSELMYVSREEDWTAHFPLSLFIAYLVFGARFGRPRRLADSVFGYFLRFISRGEWNMQ